MAADIECRGVAFSYQKNREVLRDICLSVEHGESVGLIGANGVGKSTFLKLLVGLVTGYEGEIYVQGQSVIKQNLTDIRKKVGYVFQDSDSQLFLSTVSEDVAFGPRNYGFSEAETEQRVMGALEKVKIENLNYCGLDPALFARADFLRNSFLWAFLATRILPVAVIDARFFKYDFVFNFGIFYPFTFS